MENFTMLVTPDVPTSEDVMDELRSIGAKVKKVGHSYEMLFKLNSVDDGATIMESVSQIFRKHTEAWRV